MRDATKALTLESGTFDKYLVMFSSYDFDLADNRAPSRAMKLDQYAKMPFPPCKFPESEVFPTCEIKNSRSFHSEDIDLLILKGIVADAVSNVSPLFLGDFTERDKQGRASHLRTLFNMVAPLHGHPQDAERVLQSICSVLVGEDSS